MRALSIRQPYAELILRGIKTAELRSTSTTILGERFYIYAAKAKVKTSIWSADLEAAKPPAWMIELAEQVRMIDSGAILPTGVIVGTAVIERVVQRSEVRDQTSANAAGLTSIYEWQLKDVKRLARPRKPSGHPQPVWFSPF